jgi:pimeloyl-ACP methyl ester carboxylesterase
MRPKYWTWIALACALVTILATFAGDRALMGGREVFFLSADGDRLSATYYPGWQNGGVILLEGFGSDQVTMRSAASEFAQTGLSVFSFDFSGQGRSEGGLTFDNAQTDRLAYQALAAQKEFKRLSGLDERRMVFFGHSLGARVALQAATIAAEPPAGLVLLGVQINLGTNAQSEFFTGTSDSRLEWVQQLGPRNPSVPILLLSGDWDDILPPPAAKALLCKLSGPDCQENQPAGSLEDGTAREWVVFPALPHNYEIFSPAALAWAKTWIGNLFGLTIPAQAETTAYRIGWWIAGWMAILGAAAASSRWAAAALPEGLPVPKGIGLTSLHRFLWAKLWLWLPALPLAGLVGGVVFLLPWAKPVLNLYYVGLIGAYGLLMLLLYRSGKMPGVAGALGLHDLPVRVGARRWLLAIGLAISIFLLTAAYAHSGWFYVFPFNQRLIWWGLFTPITAPGFWIGLQESALLAQAIPGRRGWRLAHALTGWVPFFLYTLFLGILGSLSGLMASVQGLLVLWLCLMLGEPLQRLTGRAWFAAFVQAGLLYGLILSQGPLFK